jgi:hypothetical protein
MGPRVRVVTAAAEDVERCVEQRRREIGRPVARVVPRTPQRGQPLSFDSRRRRALHSVSRFRRKARLEEGVESFVAVPEAGQEHVGRGELEDERGIERHVEHDALGPRQGQEPRGERLDALANGRPTVA